MEGLAGTFPSVIELRRKLDCGLRHPLLGPFCLILLALILVFTVVHGAHDQMHDAGELMACVAFLLGAIVSLALPRPHDVGAEVLRTSRGPPAATRPRARPPSRTFASRSVPLRV